MDIHFEKSDHSISHRSKGGGLAGPIRTGLFGKNLDVGDW